MATPTPDISKLEASFSTLVISIASSAVVSLGMEKNPHTGKLEKNDDLAQYSIDLLIMLRDKTRNNLIDSEKNFLDGIIQDLQMKFVQSK
jgi:hypothetical protein